jgi:hypothetical protein
MCAKKKSLALARARGWLAALGVASLIVAAATATLAGLLEGHARRAAPDRADAHLRAILASEADRIDTRLAPIRAQLYLMLDWFRAGTVSPGDTDALVALCLPLLARSPAIEAVRIAHDDGTEWMLAREDQGWLTRRVTEAEGAHRSTWMRWDRDGAPLAREERGSTAYDARRTPWYRGAIAQYDTWRARPELADPEIYFGAPAWDVPPEELRLVYALAMRGDGGDTVVCFEARPEALLRTACVCLSPEGGVVYAPQGVPMEEANALAAAMRGNEQTSDLALLVQTAFGTRWLRSAPQVLGPGTEVTLIASTGEADLRSMEDGLQRAALLAAPLAALVLTVLLRLMEAWPAMGRKSAPGALQIYPDTALSLQPPQAYLQALDSARKQTRRLRAELEAQRRDRHTQDMHWHDALARIEAGRTALHTLLAAEDSWFGAPEDALDRFATVAAHTLVLDGCSVWRRGPDGKSLQCVVRWGGAADVAGTPHVELLPVTLARAEHPMFFLAVEVESVIHSRDASTDPRLEGLIGRHGIHAMPPGTSLPAKRAFLAAPIRFGEKIDGVLCVERSGHWRPWEADEVAFAQGLAHLIAMRFRIDSVG